MAMDNPKPVVFLLFLFLFHALPPSITLAQLLPIVFSNETQVFIVHVQHPKTSSHLLAAEERDQWYLSYLPNTTLDSGEPRMVYTYAYVISGFAARLTAEEVEALEFRDGFVLAHPDQINPLQTTYTFEMLGLNRFNGPWEHSIQGDGVIIGVMDSGISPNHSSFADTLKLQPPPLKWRGRCDLPQGSGTCNNKLIGAQDFTSPPDTPLDHTGHGTHVAGIAVGSPVKNANHNGLASGTAYGMAPRAHLAVYKVCDGGGCRSSTSLKGIEQAILDGVDIIQISNGGVSSFHLSGNAKGSFRALERGILTVCSALNYGPYPSTIGNDAPWILTVGASTTGRRNTVVLKLGNGMEFAGASSRKLKFSDAPLRDVPLFYPVEQIEKRLACGLNDLDGLNVTGKIVICHRLKENAPDGHVKNLTGQSWVVKKAGGIGIIILNRIWHGYTLRSLSCLIPGLLVSHEDALKIVNYATTYTNPIVATLSSSVVTEFGVRPSPSVAAFSSRGPSIHNGGILKPDVVAPGVDILSAYPADFTSEPNGFGFDTGTSMAAPHVSGIAALLMKVHPDWSPAMIKSAIMTTAFRKDRDKNMITDEKWSGHPPANAFAVGAGHVDPSPAEDPGLVYDTRVDDYIPYLCGLKGMTVSRIISITKSSNVSCSEKMAAEQLNYPSIQVSMGSAGQPSKTVFRTVMNVGKAGSVSVYKATIVQPVGVKLDVKPQALQFSDVGEEQKFAVEIILTGSPPAGVDDVREGRLTWVSGTYRVSIPIVITQ